MPIGVAATGFVVSALISTVVGKAGSYVLLPVRILELGLDRSDILGLQSNLILALEVVAGVLRLHIPATTSVLGSFLRGSEESSMMLMTFLGSSDAGNLRNSSLQPTKSIDDVYLGAKIVWRVD